jgi:hypothetical protein
LRIRRGDDEALDRLDEVFGPPAIRPLKGQIESQQGLDIIPALGAVRQDIALQPAQIPEAEALSLIPSPGVSDSRGLFDLCAV